MNSILKTGCLVLAVTVLLPLCAPAGIMYERFESDPVNWTIADPDLGPGAEYGSLDWPASPPLAGNANALEITGGASTPVTRDDTIYAPVANQNWLGRPSLGFDFYSGQAAGARTLDAYFMGAGVMWLYGFTPVAAVGWTSYSTLMDASLNWYRWDGVPASGADFYTSLADVTQVGIVLGYQQNVGGQIYGLDNFIVVPEPETWAALLVALISLACVYRRELNARLASVSIRIS